MFPYSGQVDCYNTESNTPSSTASQKKYIYPSIDVAIFHASSAWGIYTKCLKISEMKVRTLCDNILT